jgi:hypothetical protein
MNKPLLCLPFTSFNRSASGLSSELIQQFPMDRQSAPVWQLVRCFRGLVAIEIRP